MVLRTVMSAGAFEYALSIMEVQVTCFLGLYDIAT